MKKIIFILSCVFITLTFFACSNKNTSEQSTLSSNESVGAITQTETKKFNVGVVQLVEHVALDKATQGFVDALKEALGDNVNIDVKLAQGETNNCALIANDFVSKGVDLIMANATPALQASIAATGDIPILGTSVTEYGTALSIENFSGTPGGNISGTSDLAPLSSQAKMVQEVFPDVKQVGILYCSSEANSLYQVKVITEELKKLNIEASPYSFSDSNDLASVLTNAISKCELIYIPTDNTCASNTGIIENICADAKIPVVTGEEGICKGCGSITLSIDYYDIGVTTGKMAAQILNKEKNISEMPIEYAPSFTKKYNKANCENLKINVPNDYVEIQ
ncbi:MAG: ABC transporter substrate-binding protein [Eubacteriales bacterium]|nr:ABC transporter substrate-binding protein [Eubacteriales bacterium]